MVMLLDSLFIVNNRKKPMFEMMPDCGYAVLSQDMHLPKHIIITKQTIGPVGEWDDKHVLISVDVLGHMASFVLHKDRFTEAYTNDSLLLSIKWTKVMEGQQSAFTKEWFYPIKAVIT